MNGQMRKFIYMDLEQLQVHMITLQKLFVVKKLEQEEITQLVKMIMF